MGYPLKIYFFIRANTGAQTSVFFEPENPRSTSDQLRDFDVNLLVAKNL